jgi:single-strand selective monofunctional uracil DNA glycosylase
MNLEDLIDPLVEELRALRFGPPVTHVYNPLEYARRPYEQYLRSYAKPPREIILMGMNPGPWGMAQTGVPFGEIETVREWLRIEAPVGTPPVGHPRRPVEGFACRRREVSGQRLWGWARKTFRTPEQFFSRFFVANYCPLLFIEEGGRNRTPENLPVGDKRPLMAVCDRGLRRTVAWFGPRYVVGVGRFAEERARAALGDLDVRVGGITHPSPANPKANRNWAALINKELKGLGIKL